MKKLLLISFINNGKDTILAGLKAICFISDNEGWISATHPFSRGQLAGGDVFLPDKNQWNENQKLLFSSYHP